MVVRCENTIQSTIARGEGMKNFKLRQGKNPIYPINKDIYEKVTNKKKPYFSESDKYFAICPQCDNPIQIIGLYKHIKVSPYGKHYGNDISIARYNDQAYQYCPYRQKKMSIDRNIKKRKLTGFEKNIYNTVRENYDTAIYILSKVINIRISQKLAERMLTSYIKHEAWLYPWSTLNNVPWIIGYFFPAESLYKKLIKTNSALYNAILDRCPSVYFEPSYIEGYSVLLTKEWTELYFSLYGHKRKIVDDICQETFEFRVIGKKNDQYVLIYKEILTVDETYYMNLLHKKNTYRNESLIEMALKKMPAVLQDKR